MNLKVLLSRLSLTASSNFSSREEARNEVELNMGSNSSYGKVNRFVRAYVDQQTKTLELRFFMEVNDVHVKVRNDQEELIFSEMMQTVPSLCRYINLSEHDKGYYEIHLTNEDELIIRGDFCIL